MKKVLLGSTALVAAGLLAGPAFAQLEWELSGSVDYNFGIVSEDLDTGRRAIGNTTDTTLNINSSGVSDNGLEYGSRINIDDSGADFDIDETWIFVSGSFGEVRLGQTDPAASELRFAVPSVGSGQADGDFPRYVGEGPTPLLNEFIFGTDFSYSGDDTKLVYIGEFGDITIGASFSPTDAASKSDPQLGENQNDELEGIISLGGNFQGDFGGNSFGVSFGFNTADYEQLAVPSGNDTLSEWGLGGEVGFGAITAGGFWISSTTDFVGGGDKVTTSYGLGATFSSGPWSFGANALLAEDEVVSITFIEDVIYGVGAEYSLAPGLTPYADLVIFDHDALGTADDNSGSVFLVGVTASF